MFGGGLFLLIVGGFWTYEFYNLYESVLSVQNTGGLSLIFGGQYAAINNNFGYQLLNAIGVSNSSGNPLSIVEIALAISAFLALIGLIMTIVGAASKRN